ncbi:MAG TPA: hypothetical protein VK132_07520 [Gemmatimonadales bacterium]|nr:hypothetical protein [Gemmatimonadales bacterium]
MADKTPKCPGWPHPYTVHTPDHGACEIDLAQHRWETQRKQTTMEERESRRGAKHVAAGLTPVFEED